ncbi:inorganic phosphate transporter [Thermotoga sp. KOL6]|uniref:inorganic phosphate transporter n=1 Tax=Thermotoga sp. KOL6 TaxID=126741 RepID=UPI000C78C871|nr:inorganic phosphate transporter [Thermotoga sp. KOL6]PLV58394.1 phosphate permease [Thermotoga sp. KOL6]
MILYLLPALFLGWSLGANDAANIFGPFVGSGLTPYRKATIVASIFVVIGSVVGGGKGLQNIGSLSASDLLASSLSVFSGALTVTIMTKLGIPVSTSQAVVGGIVGANLSTMGIKGVDFTALTKIFIVWLLTPTGALILSLLLYPAFSYVLRKIPNIQTQDKLIKVFAWMFGAYGAFSLGANNVANVTGVFVGKLLNVEQAAILGGISIALGILTYSKNVMMTVGKKLIELDHFTSTVAVLSQAITVWIFSLVGIPVSSSQAIVGAVLGAGYSKGMKLGNKKVLIRILSGWFLTPTISGIFSFILTSILIK